MEWLLMGVSVGIALVGLLLARSFYLENPALPERLMNRFRALYTTLLNKYWVDEIYDASDCATRSRLHFHLSALEVCGRHIIDGTVNGAGECRARQRFGLLRRLQSGSYAILRGLDSCLGWSSWCSCFALLSVPETNSYRVRGHFAATGHT